MTPGPGYRNELVNRDQEIPFRLAGVDLASKEAPGAVGTRLMKSLFAGGLHLKFTGDCALIAPPLIAEKSDIDDIVGILRDALKDL